MAVDDGGFAHLVKEVAEALGWAVKDYLTSTDIKRRGAQRMDFNLL